MRLLNYFRRRFHWVDKIGEQVTDPLKFRRLNGWLIIFWTVMLPIAIITGAVYILAFTALLSLYANWATHLGAWAGSRAEARQVEEIEDTVEEICSHCGK
jgi:hypothetical protein